MPSAARRKKHPHKPKPHPHPKPPPAPVPGAKIDISLANRSTVMKDAQVEAFAEAVQEQISAHFAPRWKIDARVHFVPGGKRLDPALWWAVYLDNSDQAGALGYHEVTSAGLPMALMFAKTALDYGDSPYVTGSHEVLEMLADPLTTAMTLPIPCPSDWGNYGPISVILEDCDACEDDSYGYDVGGLRLSDFVFPEWFDPTSKLETFDYTGNVTKPLDVLSNGYISFQDAAGNWHQYFGPQSSALYRARNKPRPHSRLELMRTPRHLWRRSTAG